MADDTPTTQAIPNPATTKWVPIWNPISEGPVGPQGPQGIQGQQGVKGDTGLQGLQGLPGEMWFAGAGVPAGALAGSVVGDWYLDTVTGDVYEKTGTSIWTLRGNIKGTPGEKWWSGSTAPGGATGAVGDWYLNTTTGDVYEKTGASTWTVIANMKGPSGSVGQHHTTHEPGGADALVNAAWTNLVNTFTQDQEIRKATPRLGWYDTAAPVDSRLWRIYASGNSLSIGAVNDAGNSVLAVPLLLRRDGSAQGQRLLLTGGYPQLTLESAFPMVNWVETGAPVDAKKWRMWASAQQLLIQTLNDAETVAPTTPIVMDRLGHVTVGGRLRIGGASNAFGAFRNAEIANPLGLAMVDVVAGDASNWAGVRASNFISTNYNNSLLDLTVNGPLVTSGNISCGGNFHGTGGYVYPGRVDSAGAYQAAWYLASHASYGLYTNTSLYAAGGIQSASYIRSGTQFSELGRAAALGNWTDYTPVIGSGGSLVTVYASRWQAVGNTLTISIYAHIDVPVVNNFTIALPAGFTASGYSCSTICRPGNTFGMAQTSTGATALYIYAGIDGSGSVGPGVYGITAHVPIG